MICYEQTDSIYKRDVQTYNNPKVTIDIMENVKSQQP